MNRKLIHIFGASGSGTTTLGRYLSEKTGYYSMDTDDYFWAPADPPFTVKRPVSERLDLMRKEIDAHDAVVLSGALSGWGDPLIPLFTLAIRVDTPTQIRLERLKQRERAHFGMRIEPGGDMAENHRAFIEWASAYDDGGPDIRSRAKHDEWQKLLPCPILQVDGSLPPEEIFETIREKL